MGGDPHYQLVAWSRRTRCLSWWTVDRVEGLGLE